MPKKKFTFSFLLSCLALLLCSCGGGGGTSSDPGNVSGPDSSPSGSSLVALAGDDRNVILDAPSRIVGKTNEGNVSLTWSLTQVPSGSYPMLVSDTDGVAYLTPDLPGRYTLTLAAENADGYVAFDEVVLTAAEPPLRSLFFPDANETVVSTTSDFGYVTTQVQPRLVSGEQSDILIVRYDWEGNILWSRYYGENWFSTDVLIKELPDKSLQLVGTTFSVDTGADFFAARLNRSGETLWQVRLEEGRAQQLLNWVETRDNGILLVGYASRPDYIYSEDLLLVKVTDQGEIEWQQQYDLGYRTWVNAVIELANGDIVLTGERYVDNGSGFFDTYDLLLARTNSLGVLQWANVYAGAFDATGDSGEEVIALDDGSLVVSGGTYNLGNMSYDGLLMKTDTNGNLLWTQLYGGDDVDILTSLQAHPDGGYIASGRSQSFELPDNSYFSAWVIRADASGNEIWSEPYLDASEVSLELVTDGFWLKGELRTTDAKRWPVWIRTDSDGFIYPIEDVSGVGLLD